MKVLFNADDLGLTKGVTDGIVKAHVEGIVGSATMMMNGYAVNYAIDLAKRLPELRVGVHLTLTTGKSISNNVLGLVDNKGYFIYNSSFENMTPPSIKEVEFEWRAQIESFLKSGLTLHHLDSHHHIHGWNPLKEVIVKLAHEYDVPVRYMPSLKAYSEILLTESLWTNFYNEGISSNLFEELKDINATSVEVMTHPAYVHDLHSISSYLDKREEERKILCSLTPPDWVDMM